MDKSVKRKKTSNQNLNKPLSPSVNIILIEKKKNWLKYVAEKLLWAELYPVVKVLVNYFSKRTATIEFGEILLFGVILIVCSLLYLIGRTLPDPNEKFKKQLSDILRKMINSGAT